MSARVNGRVWGLCQLRRVASCPWEPPPSGGFAYDQIPTRDWQANTAWQKLNLLAHNINVGFQVDVLQRPRARTAKRTASFVVSSIRTVRFEWLNRAARLVARAGYQMLRLAANPAVQDAFTRAESALDQAA